MGGYRHAGPSLCEPGLTDTSEYRSLHDTVRHPGTSAEQQLREVVRWRDASELLMLRMAREMRLRKYTWEEIGSALGMTRQGAQRFLQRSTNDLG